jgi:hypothetical protein
MEWGQTTKEWWALNWDRVKVMELGQMLDISPKGFFFCELHHLHENSEVPSRKCLSPVPVLSTIQNIDLLRFGEGCHSIDKLFQLNYISLSSCKWSPLCLGYNKSLSDTLYNSLLTKNGRGHHRGSILEKNLNRPLDYDNSFDHQADTSDHIYLGHFVYLRDTNAGNDHRIVDDLDQNIRKESQENYNVP